MYQKDTSQNSFKRHVDNSFAINQIIRRFADGDRVHYADIGDVFLDDSGHLPEAIMPDALHLSEEGYERWANAIEPMLQELGGWK